MTPAFVYIVPGGVSLVLALLTAAAYWQTRRPYLHVWAATWAAAVLYHLALIALVLASEPHAGAYALLEVVATILGWAWSVGFWLGARALGGGPPSARLLLGLLVVTALWLALVAGVLAGQPLAAPVTRLSYAAWCLAAGAVLLLGHPRTTVSGLAGAMLLLLGLQGVVALSLGMDLASTVVSGWVSSALALAIGLGVLGRLLEEEREVANARSRDLTVANDRLAELDRLKSDFVSMVSHELRTPLGLIKGYVGTLLRPDVPLDAATREEFLRVIDEETDRLTELVTNLLDMSRIEAGTLRVDQEPIPLGRVLAACAERLRAREPRRVLRVDVPERLPLVLADERRIAQVVENLLTNAVRYSPEEAPVALTARPRDGRVEVAVRDQGLGIPAEKRDQVFEKFFRVDASDTRRFAGTGLGLAICRGIVQAHGGTIWVDSEEGRGSTFAFSLAACPASQSSQEGA
jgi:signal transduction histidine kinase